MSITINNVIIDEETRNPATNAADETEAALPNPSSIKSEIDALALTFVTQPAGFPQFATNTISSTNTVTGYSLSLSSATGVATTLFVGSNQVFLYATSNSDIVVGRIGNGTTPNASGAVALVIAVDDSTPASSSVWMGLYAPLVQTGQDAVDSADQLNLSGLVTINSTFTTVTQIPFESFAGLPSGNNPFNVIFPSDPAKAGLVQLLITGSMGSDLSTVNVSTTGIGAGSQHVEPGATLRIDMVQGMNKAALDVKDPTTIDYADIAGDPDSDARVEATAADFEITQVNPGSGNTRVDIRVSAFNVAGADQEQAYLDNINANGSPVDIDPEDVIVLNGAGNPAVGVTILQDPNDPNSVIIRGLDDGATNSTTDGYQVFFTTDSVGFDRVLITNIDPQGDTFDVGNLHVTVTQGGVGNESTDLGVHLRLQDDGPTIAASGNAVTALSADETTLGTDPSGSFAGLFNPADYGADGAGTTQFILGVKSANVDSLLDDTLSGENVLLSYDSASNTIFGKTASSGVEVFRITVDADGNVTLDQSRAVVHTNTNSVDESSAAMAADLITLSARATDSEAANHNDSATTTVQIGNKFLFKDDGPALTPQGGMSSTPNNLQVDNNLGDAADSTDSSSYGLVPGADGQKSYVIVGPEDASGTFRWTYDDSAIKTAITGTVRDALGVDHDLYTLVLDPTTGGYVFTMIGEIPGSQLDLSPAEVIKAGSPDNPILEVGAAQNTDFIRMTADSTVGAGNINESHGFVGVDNGNLDTGETMFFTMHHLGGAQFNFSSISIGTKAPASTYHVVANLVGGGTYVQDLSLGKNGVINIDPTGNAMIISVEITKTGGASTKIGLGDIHVTIAPTDVQLGFSVELKDGDNDATTANFVVDIDADNDGDWESNVNALSAPVTSLSQKTVGIVDDSGMHLSMASVTYDGDHVQRDYLVL